MTSVTLQIDGMSCDHCLNTVNRVLSGVAGAAVRSVRLGRAEVDVSSEAVTDVLVAAVAKAGYRATAVAAE